RILIDRVGRTPRAAAPSTAERVRTRSRTSRPARPAIARRDEADTARRAAGPLRGRAARAQSDTPPRSSRSPHRRQSGDARDPAATPEAAARAGMDVARRPDDRTSETDRRSPGNRTEPRHAEAGLTGSRPGP